MTARARFGSSSIDRRRKLTIAKRSHLAHALLVFCAAVAVFAPAAGARVTTARAATRVKSAPPPGSAEREQAFADHVGTSADCTVYADDLYTRLTAAGITAREVDVFANLNSYDAHTFVEVKVGNRWEIQDPTFDGWWSIDGRPASTSDIQNALVQGHMGDIIWHGPAQPLVGYYVNPLLLFRIAQYVEPDTNGNLRPTTSRTVPLDELYYASAHVAGSVANVVVVSGGSDWTIGPYPLAQAPDGRWISPIIFAAGLTLAGNGPGQETVLQVPRFPVKQIAASASAGRGTPDEAR
jgi:hypothetical protein